MFRLAELVALAQRGLAGLLQLFCTIKLGEVGRRAIAKQARNSPGPVRAIQIMTDTVEHLILDLVEWVSLKERTYQETLDAWRTSCPRLPVWEDATDRGLVETTFAGGRSVVRATPAGLALLKETRPHVYDDLATRSVPGSSITLK